MFFLAAEPLTVHWIAQLNGSAEPLHDLYGVGKERKQTYEEMTERVLKQVRLGHNVCFVSYGHPGVFADPMHEAVRRARDEGYMATMLPAISAEDCLFADLGVDPGRNGCQSFEATDFLLYRRKFDPRSALILWQVGVIGELGYKNEYDAWNPDGLIVLRDELLKHYSPSHNVAIYDATPYAVGGPGIQWVELSNLMSARVGVLSTLYVSPQPRTEPDMEMVRKLGLVASAEIS